MQNLADVPGAVNVDSASKRVTFVSTEASATTKSSAVKAKAVEVQSASGLVLTDSAGNRWLVGVSTMGAIQVVAI